MILSRAVLLAELNRYLQEHPRKHELMRELERRLPDDGREKPTQLERLSVQQAQAGKSVPEERLLWWFPQDGEPIHIYDLRNGHLINILQMLMRGFVLRQIRLSEDQALSEAWAQSHPQLPLLIREARWRGLDIPEVGSVCRLCGHPVHPPGVDECSHAPGGTPCDCPGEPECRWCERGMPRVPSAVKPGGFVHVVPEVGREVCLRTEE